MFHYIAHLPYLISEGKLSAVLFVQVNTGKYC